MLLKRYLIFLFLISFFIRGQSQINSNFDSINNSKKWKLSFEDDCSKDWKKKWFLDGELATLSNTSKGLSFSAGPTEGDDSNHAVLWTKPSFKGSVKIEYSYTKTDYKTTFVNILYILATGVSPYPPDIYEWKNERTIPSMKTYFNNMKTLHISYAAFNNSTEQEYVRARKYPVKFGKNFSKTTEIPPSSFNTGLFKPNETYNIIVIKNNNKLYFKVEGKTSSKLFEWDISNLDPIDNGRVGIRHMYTRSATYKDFKISVIN